jgi:dTDP-4-amino-4,6-dideoxygalactose transaminase
LPGIKEGIRGNVTPQANSLRADARSYTSAVRPTLPLVDLGAVHRELGEELEAAVLDVIRSRQFVGGARVESFERAFAAYLGVDEAIGVANGTDALELAVRALGIEPGAEVLVPANSFIASAAAVAAAGAVPRFVDVEEDTGLLDLASCEERVSDRTRAVMAVHLYGRMADMDAVTQFAQRHSLAVIEDAAQAHGAQRAGRRAGSIGHVACFSFYPAKNLGAFGDAGVLVTSDPSVAARVRLLSNHGRSDPTTHEVIGRNSRIDPLHAAVLEIKLRHLDDWNERRRAAAEVYRRLLAPELPDKPLDEALADVYHLFPVRTADRAPLMARLAEAGVQTGIHYPQTIPSSPAFAGSSDECPVAERRAALQFSLPMHPHLSKSDVEYISGVVMDWMRARGG